MSQATTDLGGISHNAAQSEKTTESQFQLPPGGHSIHHTLKNESPTVNSSPPQADHCAS